MKFQSTPTGFPAGDSSPTIGPTHLHSFNPRRPVSRPATDVRVGHGASHCRFNPRRPVSRPATTPWPPAHSPWIVSIHADRFPGRRPGTARGSTLMTRFNPRRPVSRPATLLPLRLIQRDESFNPRRPVSRPATSASLASFQTPSVSIHADRFPGRRLFARRGRIMSSKFQSTPTGFPAGDHDRQRLGKLRDRFNPRRPVSRPATGRRVAPVMLEIVSIHADRFPGRRREQKSTCRRWHCFNPRRPVSRPATTAPTSPAPTTGSFNPRRPVSRPATPA